MKRPMSCGHSPAAGVRVEDFEEVAEALALGLEAERPCTPRAWRVEREVVVERDRVQPEVGAPSSPLVRLGSRGGRTGCGRASRVRNGRDGAVRVVAAADDVDVGRVVGAGGRRDGDCVEQPLLDRQHFAGAGRHEHDVDEPLPDDLAIWSRYSASDARARRVHSATCPARRWPAAMSASLASARMKSCALRVGVNAGELGSSDFMPVRCRVGLECDGAERIGLVLAVIETDPDRMTGPPGVDPSGKLGPRRDTAGRVGRFDARCADRRRARRRLPGSSPRSSAARKPAIVQSPAPVVPATCRARKRGDTTSRSHHASGVQRHAIAEVPPRAGSSEVRT